MGMGAFPLPQEAADGTGGDADVDVPSLAGCEADGLLLFLLVEEDGSRGAVGVAEG